MFAFLNLGLMEILIIAAVLAVVIGAAVMIAVNSRNKND
jgi:hypothetical protein